jgi:ATP/maltotriose-dependent transcriptional regulator MalT
MLADQLPWISLARSDNEPSILGRVLAAPPLRSPPVRRRACRDRRGERLEDQRWRSLSPSKALAESSDDRVLVLDDYPGIISAEIHGDLEFFIR